MAKKIVVKSKVKKIKRKFPVKLVAPDYLNSYVIGNSEVTDLSKLVGKTSKINLMYVTRNMKNQNVRLTFKVIEVSAGLAKTQVSAYAHVPYYLRRFVKKDTELVEDSFVCISKDGVSFKVKPFIITKVKSSNLVLTALRNNVKSIVSTDFSNKSYNEIVSGIVQGKEQIYYKNQFKSIVPLKLFEFKKVELN